MKVLVYPHHLEIGGSQVNAIDLAASSRDRFGHDVVMFATPGPASKLVHEAGIRLLEAPSRRTSPSPTMIRALRAAVRDEQPDLVHAWDWPQCLDAFFGVYVFGTPVLGSNMAMVFPRFVPVSMPLTAGTEETVAAARSLGAESVRLLEPPVDTARDDPFVVDPGEFKRVHALDDGHRHVMVISRLVGHMKLDGLRLAIAAVASLARKGEAVRLVIVGEGTAFADLEREALAVNASTGRRTVVLTGPVVDPRPAYAAADIVLGQGGSILRGMAFAKPTIVLGVEGYAEIFDPRRADRYFWHGMLGVGEPASPQTLAEQIQRLLSDDGLRSELGNLSRKLVLERYSLEHVTALLDQAYTEALTYRPPWRHIAADAARSMSIRVAGKVVPTRMRRSVVNRSSSRAQTFAGVGTPSPRARERSHD